MNCDESDQQETNNDLIIDEGFPALNTFKIRPGAKDSTTETDPIPRCPFASFSSAIQIDETQMENIFHDCLQCFNARAKEDNDAYSSGSTFFLPAVMKPRCALEDLAMQIFKAHTEGLIPGTHYDLERSGAEWWTLVLDLSSAEKDTASSDNDDDEDDDEVGMHFDADYGLEEQLPNYMLHPRIATVTYFSDLGVPTLVLDKKSPPPSDVEKETLNGSINKGWLSFPETGKQIAFDGRLLHGAPGEFFPGKKDNRKLESDNKRRKLDNGLGKAIVEKINKRITFMVNVWINHCPIDAELCDEHLCTKMKTVWEPGCDGTSSKTEGRLKGDADYTPSLQVKLSSLEKGDELQEMVLELAQRDSKNAGENHSVVCNRELDMKFSCSMKRCHKISENTYNCNGKSAVMKFEDEVLNLKVGTEVVESEDEESD